MQTYKRQPVEFVRGEGAPLYDARGRGLSRLPGRDLGLQRRPLPPRGWWRRFATRPARLLHGVEPVLQRAAGPAGASGWRRASSRAPGCSLQLRHGGERGGDQACPQAPSRRGDRGAGGRVPRAHDGRAVGHAAADKQEPFAPLVPGFRAVPRDDPDALAAAVGDSTAAVLLEPVQGETASGRSRSGCCWRLATPATGRGALLIFDEIQCGMGRTGTLWAFELTPVRPDVLTAAKALANGLPVGACIARGEPPTCCSPATMGRPSAADRWWPRPRSRRSTSSTTTRCSSRVRRARRPPAGRAGGAARRRPPDRRAWPRPDGGRRPAASRGRPRS